MKPREIRIAVANAIGDVCNRCKTADCHCYACLRYEESLDAMHKAEEMLSEHDWMTYRRWLIEITPEEWSLTKSQIHATAAQRAEAFLRTLNLWKE